MQEPCLLFLPVLLLPVYPGAPWPVLALLYVGRLVCRLFTPSPLESTRSQQWELYKLVPRENLGQVFLAVVTSWGGGKATVSEWISSCCCFSFSVFFEAGSYISMYLRMTLNLSFSFFSWNSLCRPGRPQTHRDPPSLLRLKASSASGPPPSLTLNCLSSWVYFLGVGVCSRLLHSYS